MIYDIRKRSYTNRIRRHTTAILKYPLIRYGKIIIPAGATVDVTPDTNAGNRGIETQATHEGKTHVISTGLLE